MDLFPEDRISLSQGNGRSLELAFRVFQIFVDLRLVIEIESNGPVDLRALEERKVFLNSLGRLAFEGALGDFFRAGLSGDLQLLDLTPVIAEKTNALPRHFHGDPFDRTIATTASTLDLILITTDTAIRDAEVCAVEYYPFKAPRPRHP